MNTEQCGIYKLENNINHKCYIGQSININKRIREHRNAAFNPNNRDYELPIHRALRKYGEDNFTLTILEECPLDKDILNEREIYWIDYYNSYNNGYNAAKGGNNSDHIGKPVELYDMDGNFIKEICNAATVARELDLSYNTVIGVLHHERLSCGGYQMKFKDDNYKISKYKSRQGGSKTVYQYDLNNNYIAEYSSVAEASRQTHADSSTISKVCRGKLKSTAGYKWSYTKI